MTRFASRTPPSSSQASHREIHVQQESVQLRNNLLVGVFRLLRFLFLLLLRVRRRGGAARSGSRGPGRLGGGVGGDLGGGRGGLRGGGGGGSRVWLCEGHRQAEIDVAVAVEERVDFLGQGGLVRGGQGDCAGRGRAGPGRA